MPKVSKVTLKKKVIKESAWDRISGISFDEDDGISLNLYGRSGTGKTRTWSTFPGPILCFTTSGGEKSGELRSVRKGDRSKIKQLYVNSTEEMHEVLDKLKKDNPFSTVVSDHGTGLQDMMLKEILGLDELPAQVGWGVAEQQDWQQCTAQVKEIYRKLLSLPKCNKVIVAQEREFKSETNSELIAPYVGSALTPALTGWLNTAVDYIGQTFIRQKTKEITISKGIGKKKRQTTKLVPIKGKYEYCLRTGTHDIYTTKFRVSGEEELETVIIDPSYDKIMAVIEGAD